MDSSRHWAGLPLLDRLLGGNEFLTSQEVARIVGARSIKGVGSVLKPTRATLERAGIRLEEAVRRRKMQRRTVWTAGKRIRQARHVLNIERQRFARGPRRLVVPTGEPEPDYRGPILIIRALKVWGDVYQIDGGMTELDCLIDDEFLGPVADETDWRVGEVFVERIEPAESGTEIPVPIGYEENGIWVRGEYDYAHSQVAGAIGTGRFPTMFAYVGEAAWVERRMPLVDAARQVDAIRISEGFLSRGNKTGWHVVNQDQRFRHVWWMSSRADWNARRSAPPLRMRLRCWYDVVIELLGGRRVVLHEEGLRGDEGRTASRAIARWRATRDEPAGRLVSVRDIRISKKQPRPIPPAQSNS